MLVLSSLVPRLGPGPGNEAKYLGGVAFLQVAIPPLAVLEVQYSFTHNDMNTLNTHTIHFAIACGARQGVYNYAHYIYDFHPCVAQYCLLSDIFSCNMRGVYWQHSCFARYSNRFKIT